LQNDLNRPGNEWGTSIGDARSASRPIYRVLQTMSIKGPPSPRLLSYFSFHRSAGLHAA